MTTLRWRRALGGLFDLVLGQANKVFILAGAGMMGWSLADGTSFWAYTCWIAWGVFLDAKDVSK